MTWWCTDRQRSNTLAVSIAAAVPVKLMTTGKVSLLLSGLSMVIFAFDCLVSDLIVSPFRPTNAPKKLFDTGLAEMYQVTQHTLLWKQSFKSLTSLH